MQVRSYDHGFIQYFSAYKKPSDSTPLRRSSLRADKVAKSYTRTKTRPLNARSNAVKCNGIITSLSRTLFQLGAVRCGTLHSVYSSHSIRYTRIPTPPPKCSGRYSRNCSPCVRMLGGRISSFSWIATFLFSFQPV